MANFTKNISNVVNCFGGSPSSKWGEWNWNAFKWGDGTADFPVIIRKLISNDLSSDSAIGPFSVKHIISESLSLDSEPSREVLTDGSGYAYVYVSDTINAEDRAVASYISGAGNNSNWMSLSVATTIWS